MTKPFFTFLFVAVSFMFSACSTDDGPNFNFLPLQILSAELPDSFELNGTYEIRMTYLRPDSCTSFANFDVSDKDTTVRNVVIFGAKRTDKENCVAVAEERMAFFNFIVKYSESYTFRFWQGENENGEQEYLEVEVPVN